MKFQTDYEKNDLKSMAELGESNYDKHNDIANISFLEWQYFGNPVGKAMVVLAIEEESGALTGEIAQIPLKFNCFGREITATCLVNSLIKKEHRNISLFYQLQTESFDLCKNNAFAFAVPNPFSYPLFSRLFSCKTVAQIPLLLLPVHPKALVQAKINRTFAKIVPNLSYKGMAFHVSDKIEGKLFSMDEIKAFDVFWEKIKNKYPIMGARTSDYITWRYLSCPTRDYAIFIAKDGADILGYCIVGENELDGIKTGFLLDFLVLPGRKDAAKVLLKRGIAHLCKDGADLIGTLMFSHCEEYHYLKQYGFLNCPGKFLPQPFPFIVKENGSTMEEQLNEPKNWFLTMGDYDAV